MKAVSLQAKLVTNLKRRFDDAMSDKDTQYLRLKGIYNKEEMRFWNSPRPELMKLYDDCEKFCKPRREAIEQYHNTFKDLHVKRAKLQVNIVKIIFDLIQYIYRISLK